MNNDKVIAVLNSYGVSIENNSDDLSEQVADVIGQTIGRAIKDRTGLAILCALLCKLKRLRPKQVIALIAAKFPQHQHNLAWVSRLCRGGLVLLDHPHLADLSIDKLCSLSRLPKACKKTVLESSRLPNGLDIRDLTREELASEVRALITPNTSLHIEPARRAKMELIKFINSFTSVIDELSQTNDLGDIAQQLSQWHHQLVELIKSRNTNVRTPIFISDRMMKSIAHPVDDALAV